MDLKTIVKHVLGLFHVSHLPEIFTIFYTFTFNLQLEKNVRACFHFLFLVLTYFLCCYLKQRTDIEQERFSQ